MASFCTTPKVGLAHSSLSCICIETLPAYVVDIFHYTLYWHLIFHALIFGLTGLWFTFVALLSPTSSVGVRSLSGRRTKTDFRTNTEVAEEGVFDVDVEGDAKQAGTGRKGSASDNEAAKGGIRERARRGSSSRAIRGLGEQKDLHPDDGDDQDGKEETSNGKHKEKLKPRRTSSAEGLKIMDFAENPDDIPLIPTKSGRSGPPRSGSGSGSGPSSSGGIHHPRPRRPPNDHARGRTISMLSARSEQSSDLETHPTGAFSGARDRPVRRPPRSPSPPSMEMGMDRTSPDLADLTLDRPISHTDAPMPNQSQYSLHREEDLSREASMQEQRSRARAQGGEETGQDHDRLGPLKSLFSASHHEHLQAHTHFDPRAIRAKPKRIRPPKHSRRPAPIWLAALPFPFFALWGLVSAVIMSTIIGFTLSAVYNTAGFEMST